MSKKKWKTYSSLPANNSEFQREISKDAIGEACRCRDRLLELDAGYQSELYKILAVAYAITWHLEREWEEWCAFIKDPFFLLNWKKPPRPKRQRGEKMLYVMYFVFDATSKLGRDRAWKYARALSLYNMNSVPSASVAEKLKADGGVEAVCRQATAEHPRRKKSVIGSDDYYPDLGVLMDDEEQDEQFVLEVEMDYNDGEKVLRLGKGRRARITVKRTPGEDDWKRIVATRVKLLKAK